jgi:hypothetical protein
MAQVTRWFLGHWNGRLNCTFSWGAINHQSVVLVSASEGRDPVNTQAPERFIGAADVTVKNIAPFDGGVGFVLGVDWGSPLPIWADIVVLDEFPQGFVR